MKFFKGFTVALCLLLISAFALTAAVTVVEAARVHTATQVALNGGANGCTLSGATNANPIVYTCTQNHNLVTGDEVQITGIVGNTAGNGTGFVSVASATTFSVYTTAALTTAFAGNGGYSSGGAVSEALDISGLSAPWTIQLQINFLTAGGHALISVQDSADGFVSDVKTLGTYNVEGGVTPSAPIVRTWRDYSLPSARVGIANGRLRVVIESIDIGTSVTTSLFIQN